jgi:hypothetical protein
MTPAVSDYTPAEGKEAKQWKGSLEACGGPSSPLRNDPKWMKKHNCSPVLINRIPIDVPGIVNKGRCGAASSCRSRFEKMEEWKTPASSKRPLKS